MSRCSLCISLAVVACVGVMAQPSAITGTPIQGGLLCDTPGFSWPHCLNAPPPNCPITETRSRCQPPWAHNNYWYCLIGEDACLEPGCVEDTHQDGDSECLST
jgi:hypothetical protein